MRGGGAGAESHYVDAGDDMNMGHGFQSPRSYVDGGRRQRAVNMVPGGIASVTGRQYNVNRTEAALVQAPQSVHGAYDPNQYSALPATSADACFATFL